VELSLKKICALALCFLITVVFARSVKAATIAVPAGGNLQAALNAAQPGDTITLPAGATFNGPFELPVKGGTAPITIRSATPDTSFPANGQRINPTYSPLLAKIRSTTAGPAIMTARGTTNWRLLFLEFLPASAASSPNLVEFGSGGADQNTLSAVPQHLVIDRCYLHGDPSFGHRRGLALNSGDTRVANSYFADFKATGNDTQAIGSWNGPGPYVIDNNYLEAAGESIMFGGSDPSIPNLVASNITITRNLVRKPLAWMTQSWIVKNLIEFKNAQNAVVEGNTIENNWTAAQQGYAILFTPRNQNGTAPWTVVKNITVRSNIIRHVAAAFSIAGWDDTAASQQTQNIAIVNNLVYDVSPSYHISGQSATGWFAVIGGGPRDITIEHNTVDNGGGTIMTLYAGAVPSGATTAISGFVLRNNLFRNNAFGVFGDTVGQGTVAFNRYTPNAIVLRNTFAGSAANQYPTGNDFPTIAQWLADFVSVASANYQLVATSLSKGSATDGTDIGVNFSMLNAALAGTSTPPPPPSPPPSGNSTPFGGTPAALPGTVQFENYDVGGKEVAYHDTTPGNTGGVYRGNSVDIQATSDTGGGYNLGWVVAGEWLKYTVSVATARAYTLDIRVASKTAGGTFHVEVDGVDKTGPIAIPNTGAWQTWTTITKTGIALPAGQHVLRFVMDANGASGAVGNLNWFAFR
jgi:carbohydrate binding protein with CBM6 domain